MNFQNKVTLLVMQENLTQYNDPSTTEQENGETFRNNNTLKRAPRISNSPIRRTDVKTF